MGELLYVSKTYEGQYFWKKEAIRSEIVTAESIVGYRNFSILENSKLLQRLKKKLSGVVTACFSKQW
jgi:hypothetical protein